MQTENWSKLGKKEDEKQNSNYQFKKKKIYSEYFKSRIFEIPIEMNLKKDNIHIEIQTPPKNYKETEAQTEATSESEYNFA